MSPDNINAAASVVSAGGAVGIPIILAWIGYESKRRDDNRAEAAEMRQFSSQWQDYNLIVLSSTEAAEAIFDHDFYLIENRTKRSLNTVEKQQLHAIFFKLTAMYQAYYAMQEGCIKDTWPLKIIADLAPTVFENDGLVAIALKNRGYSEDFIEFVLKARDRKPISKPQRKRDRRFHHLVAALCSLAIVADAAFTFMAVRAALAAHPPADRKAGMVRNDRPIASIVLPVKKNPQL